MTESPKADEPDWSGLNLPVLTEVVDEQAVPTLAEEASAEAEVPEFDFSSELDLLAAELDEGEHQLEIPELTLDELLEPAKPEAETVGGLDFSGLPSLELADADVAAEGEELGFVLEPKAEAQAQAQEADGLAALMARADLQPPVGEDPAATTDAAAPAVSEEMGWGDVVAAASELPADAHQSPTDGALGEGIPAALPALEQEDALEMPGLAEVESLPELPILDAADESEATSAPTVSPDEPVPTAQAADAPPPFTSISIDSLPSGVLGGGAGREPPPSSGLEWLSELPSQQQAEPPKPTIKDMIAEAERVLAEERAKQEAANREVAQAFGLPQREEPHTAATPPAMEPEFVPETELADVEAVLPGVSLDVDSSQASAAGVEQEQPALPEDVAHDVGALALESEAPQAFAETPIEPALVLEAEPQTLSQSPAEPVSAGEPDVEQALASSVPDESSEHAAAELALDPDMPIEAFAAAPQLAEASLPVAGSEPLADAGLKSAPELIEIPTDAPVDSEPVVPALAGEKGEPSLEALSLSDEPVPFIEAEPLQDGALAPEEEAQTVSLEPALDAEPALVEPAPDHVEPLSVEADLTPSPEDSQPDEVIPPESAALAEPAGLEPVGGLEPAFAEEAVASGAIPHVEAEAFDESDLTQSIQSEEMIASEAPAPVAPADSAELVELASDEALAHIAVEQSLVESVDAEAPVEGDAAEAAHLHAEPALDEGLAALEPASPEVITEAEHGESVKAEPAVAAPGDAVSTLYEAVPQPAPLEDEDMPALSGLLGRSLAAPALEDVPAATQDAALDVPVSVVKVAAMSSAAGAGRQGPPAMVLDEQALFNSLYERMLPRMKVELSLWLQDAIEVQAKQMLSGMMHQLKEDYEMLFGDALKESLRQALSDGDGVRRIGEDGHE